MRIRALLLTAVLLHACTLRAQLGAPPTKIETVVIDSVHQARPDGTRHLDMLIVQFTAPSIAKPPHWLCGSADTIVVHVRGAGALDMSALIRTLADCGNVRALSIGEVPAGSWIDELPRLTALKELSLYQCSLTAVPEAVRSLRQLQELDVSWNGIAELPPWLGELSELQVLSAYFCDLLDLPASIAGLHLEVLGLGGNEHLKPAALERLGSMESIEALNLRSCGLSEWPDALWRLPRLRELVIRGNALGRLDSRLKRLTTLQHLDVDSIGLARLPDSCAFPASLRNLSANGNRLVEVPSRAVDCVGLKSVFLAGNPLKPGTVEALRRWRPGVSWYQ